MADGARGQLRRFLFEHHPVRGHHVDLGAAWQELRAVHAYPIAVETLLGEAVAASVLLAATLKFDGRLTLQFTGHGAVSLLVAQCTHDFRIRAVAQHGDDVPPLADVATLVGDGRLAVTVESGEQGGRYQGIVPLEGDGIAACLETYFAGSEQLPTSLRLHASGDRAAGVLLQRLRAISGTALLLPSDQLLPQLCGELDCRLFAATPVTFHCGCGDGRVAQMLRSLGEAELRDIVREQGAVTVHCEFCRRVYRFDAIDVETLIAGRNTDNGPQPRPN